MERVRNARIVQLLQREFTRSTQLYLLDHLLCLFIVTPLMVGYYKGVFFILDNFFLTDYVMTLSIVGTFGFSCNFLALLCQDLLEPMSRRPREPAFYFVKRIYNLFLGLANTLIWYFVWCMSHWLLANQVGGVLRVLVSTTVALMCLRCYPSVIAVPPFYFLAEQQRNFFAGETRFQCKPSSSLPKFVLDVAFSVFVVQTLVVLMWKNAWTLMDLSLYPGSFQSTTVASLIYGYCTAIAVYALQTTALAVANRLRALPRIIFVNCWLWVTSFTCINVWRGLWYLGDLFVQFERYNSWLPVVCLLLLKTFFSDDVLATKGVFAEYQFFPAKARVTLFPINYFQTISEIDVPPKNNQSIKLLNQREELIKEKTDDDVKDNECATQEKSDTCV